VLGPVAKQRWIYACSKQLMDRVIYAYGEEGKLNYTLFRPFNWFGPKLDNIWAAKEGSSRVLTQFIGNIIRRESIQLVDGGSQRRCFLYIDDAIDALIRIIENKDGQASKRIFNIGDPKNDLSIRELAELLVRMIARYPGYESVAKEVKVVPVGADEYYGKGYQDITLRVPSIRNAERYLGWKPKTELETAVKKTLDYYLVSKPPETGDLDFSRL
jgi:nucleoside-diphosphate-sugar epimerase